jgi:hypothetical protein
MRTKIALILAFASFLAITALGTALAGAEPLSDGAAVDPSATTTTAIPSLQAPACANGVDDDGDGLLDEGDPDCEDPEDTNEAPDPATSSPAPSESAPVPSPAPAPSAPEEQSGGIKQGSTIGGGSAGKGGATENDSLGDPSGGGGSTGAVTAPGINGGGDQPLAKGADGGSQYDDGGSPTATNPTTTFAPFGPAPIGVPNFVIDSFEIPPFLLPIYQACGTEYGIPWEVLASINKIETGFGTNLNISSAGALG